MQFSSIEAVVLVSVGAIITIVTTRFASRNEARLRVLEKVLDKRISAHEALNHELRLMIVMNIVAFDDSPDGITRYPSVLRTRDDFSVWYNQYMLLCSSRSLWFSEDLTREINLFYDYLIELFRYVGAASDEDCRRIGVLVRQDFIDFCGSIDRHVRTFLQEGISDLSIQQTGAHVKYQRKETERRLAATCLMRERASIEQFCAPLTEVGGEHEDS